MPRLEFRGENANQQCGIFLEGARALLTELSSSSPGSTGEKRETPALPQGTPRRGRAKRRNGQYGDEPASPPCEVPHLPAACRALHGGWMKPGVRLHFLALQILQ